MSKERQGGGVASTNRPVPYTAHRFEIEICFPSDLLEHNFGGRYCSVEEAQELISGAFARYVTLFGMPPFSEPMEDGYTAKTYVVAFEDPDGCPWCVESVTIHGERMMVWVLSGW